MSLPAVNIEEQDGALGVLPAGQRLLAIAGVSTSGPLNTPAAYAKKEDVIALFGKGPLVEMAAYAIVAYQKPVVVVRTAGSVDGTVGDATITKTGTATVALSADPTPIDDLEVVVKIINGGTKGVAGITYRESLDGGRHFGALKALGTASAIVVADAGVGFDIGTGTLVAGDTYAVATTAPNFSPADLGDALDALGNSTLDWEGFDPVGALEADHVDQIETKFSGFGAKGKYCYWLGHARMQDKPGDESDSDYQLAVIGELSGKATTHGGITAGDTKFVSQVTGSTQRRPLAFAAGALQANVSEEINIADVNIGALLGVSIRDSKGNADEHDEAINPGLDDARFITARTWENEQGVYVTKPRLFSAEGSDFQIIPHRRVMNLGHRALRSYFVRRLANPILVDRRTGFILEREALEIEAGATAAMRSLIMAKPKASAVSFTLSRTDNLLSTKTLTGQGFIVPFGYPEQFNLTLSFQNPASSPVIALAA